MALFMGIDLGTQSVKVSVYTETGELASTGSRPYEISTPHTGWAEQDVTIWWTATVIAIRESLTALTKNAYDVSALQGLGLSGQMHGLVALDKNDSPLRPAIIHCDQRSMETIKRIYEKISMQKIGDITCNRLSPGFLLASLIWIREQEPAIYDQIHTVLSPKDYIRFRLTGEIGTEQSDASGTCVYDVSKHHWSDEILSALELDKKIFPAVHASDEESGIISDKIYQETCLPSGLPVYYGGSDQPLQALGNGVMHRTTATSTIGTSGQIFLYCDMPKRSPLLNTNTFCNVLPDTWYAMGACMSAGAAHSWFGKKIIGRDDYKELDAEIADIPCGSDGVLFLPYLMGERTPHMDPDAKGVMYGLTLRTDYRHCVRAVMEGVCYALRECLDVLQEQYEEEIETLIASGGGAKSNIWLQMQADIFERPVFTSPHKEAASLGAAMVAAAGSRFFPDIQAACRAMSAILSDPIEPCRENRSIYREGFQKYREIYQRLQDLFGV